MFRILRIAQKPHTNAQIIPPTIENIRPDTTPHTKLPEPYATANKQKRINNLQFLISFLYIHITSM
nr:MAG TPA: hypothetical protein [Caudoviricetes sp.]DAU78806.1 MAG TPA: hypothetical protein [Caudoviricetes sp.]